MKQRTEDKLNYISADSWVKIDRFEKFKIMLVCLNLTIENDKKLYEFLLFFCDFGKLAFIDKSKHYFVS